MKIITDFRYNAQKYYKGTTDKPKTVRKVLHMEKYLATTTPNKYIKVYTYYKKDSMNYFTYKNEARGYYLSVTPVERARGFESFVAFTGFKVLLKEVTRASKKAEAEAEAIAERDWRKYAEIAAKEAGLQIIE